MTVETLAASREYVYIPGTANELSGARVTENERDSTSRARGVLGAFTGGFTAGAAGICAAIFFGLLVAMLFRSKDKQ